MRRILDAMSKLKTPWHRVRLNKDIKADIDWWLRFYEPHNGQTPMIDTRPVEPLWTDACNIAAGAVFRGQFFYTAFKTWPDVMPKHINYKETLALEPAVRRWAHCWMNRRIILYCDNQAAVGIINKGSCHDPVVMASLRWIAMMSAKHNFKIQAQYYPGCENVVADAVSRLHEPRAVNRLKNILTRFVNPLHVPSIFSHPTFV